MTNPPARNANSHNSKNQKPAVDMFRPFPVDVFPQTVARFITDVAKAIGCDRSFVALPVLSVLAAAIGNSRRIVLKRGWSEPAIVWAAIVGESGTQKTPPLKTVMRPIQDRQRAAFHRHEQAIAQHRAELELHAIAMRKWKAERAENGENDTPAPTKPREPQAERSFVGDTTVEALAPILRDNARGVLLYRDELAGWIGSFDRYAATKGKSSDVQQWLSIHNGDNISVDRKTGTPPTIFVPMAAVSVAGGIQPATLRRALTQEHMENGLGARLLFAFPPRRPKRWTDADISETVEQSFAAIIERLYDMKMKAGINGDLRPVFVPMTPAGKDAYIAFYNAHAAEQADLTGDLSAAWSKLEGYAARFALILHFARWATDDPTLESESKIDVASVEAGVKLSQWFANETRRVYAMLNESDEQAERRRVVDWIAGKGGRVTARDVQRGLRHYDHVAAAETMLASLALAGYGTYEHQPPGDHGGRPTRVFELIQSADADETPGIPGKCEVVSTSTEKNEDGMQCDHQNPDRWRHRDGRAYCPGCDRFMGRLSN